MSLANRVYALESATNSRSTEEQVQINKIDGHLNALSHKQILSDTREASISGISTNFNLENKKIIHKILSALELDALLQFIFEIRNWGFRGTPFYIGCMQSTPTTPSPGLQAPRVAAP